MIPVGVVSILIIIYILVGLLTILLPTHLTNTTTAHSTEETWTIAIVDNDGDVGRFASLAIDQTGNPAIAYYDASEGHPKLAWWNGSAWKIEIVDYNLKKQFV